MLYMQRGTAVRMLVFARLLRSALETETDLPVSHGFLADLDVLIDELQTIIDGQLAR
jgi:hypothetical protein